MKKIITGLSIVSLLFVFGAAPGCGEQEYVDPGEVEGVEVDLGDVPPLGGEDTTGDDE